MYSYVNVLNSVIILVDFDLVYGNKRKTILIYNSLSYGTVYRIELISYKNSAITHCSQEVRFDKT